MERTFYKNYSKNPRDYEFVFEHVMRSSIARDVFHRYLRDHEKSSEIIDFLDGIRDYQRLILDIYGKSPHDRMLFATLAQEIIDKYLQEESLAQVNVSMVVVDQLQEKLEKTIKVSLKLSGKSEQTRTELCKLQYDLFSEVESNVLYMLKCDGFRRCIQSSMWKRFVDRCVESKEHLQDIMVKVGERYAKYTLDDIKRPKIVEEDFVFTCEVCSDHEHWILTGNENGMKIYKSHREFIIPTKNKNTSTYQRELDKSLRRLKNPRRYVFTTNHHYERVFATLLSEEFRQATDTFKYTLIGFTNATETDHATMSLVVNMAMPFPIRNREAAYLSSTRRQTINGKDACVMVIRPYNDSHVDKIDHKAERCRLMECWTFVQLDDNTTEVTLVLFMEYGGWMKSDHIQRMLINQQSKLVADIHSTLNKTLEQAQLQNYPRPNNLRLLETYEQNNKAESIYSKLEQ